MVVPMLVSLSICLRIESTSSWYFSRVLPSSPSSRSLPMQTCIFSVNCSSMRSFDELGDGVAPTIFLAEGVGGATDTGATRGEAAGVDGAGDGGAPELFLAEGVGGEADTGATRCEAAGGHSKTVRSL